MNSELNRQLFEYSRKNFEESSDRALLSASLEGMLLERLRVTENPATEALEIVEDLKRAGHDLWSWDESDDFTVWGDNYINPPLPTRFLIGMYWPTEDDPSQPFKVTVSFGIWPKKNTD
ncbi:MAG TPA: hypothetical protein DD636_00635 [Anaerolineaceae bacterium]|nr:hypothetical protein [Anaerolineaceae bacterium]